MSNHNQNNPSSSFNLEPPGGWMRDIKLMGKYFRLKLMSAVEYKLGFLTIFTSILLNLGVWFVYWNVILNISNTRSFGSWGPQELVVWYFFTEFSVGLFGLFVGVATVYYFVINDGLEPILSKPYHPLVHIIGEGMYVLSIVRCLFSFVILIIGAITFDIQLNLLNLIFGLTVSLLGIVIFICLYIFVQTFSFWIGNVEFLVETLVDLEMNFVRLPQNFIPNFVLYSILVIIPVGLFATIPTFLAFNSSIFGLYFISFDFLFVLCIFILTLLIFVFTMKFFSYGLKFYDGVGE